MRKLIFKNLLSFLAFIIEILALSFWYSDILSISLWGMQDAEFKQEDVNLYYSVFNVFLICGIIILIYLILSSVLSHLAYKTRNKNAFKTYVLLELIFGILAFGTFVFNFVLGYIRCKANLTLQGSFSILSLPLIIGLILFLIFNGINLIEFIKRKNSIRFDQSISTFPE